MSRTNARVAHTLRESESLRVKKSILKAGTYDAATASSEVMANLDAANDHYLERLKNLKKFSSNKKTKAKTSSLLNEWSSEYLRLQSLSQKIEASVSDVLRNALIESPEFLPLIELLQEQDTAWSQYKSYRRHITQQIHSVKELMKESKKMVEKQISSSDRSNANAAAAANETNDSLVVDRNMAVVSILAELLMSQRTETSEQLIALNEEENKYKVMINTFKQQLWKMLRNDRNEVQNEQLRAEFLQILKGTESSVLHRVGESATESTASSSSRAGNRSTNTAQNSQRRGSSSIIKMETKQLSTITEDESIDNPQNDDDGSYNGASEHHVELTINLSNLKQLQQQQHAERCNNSDAGRVRPPDSARSRASSTASSVAETVEIELEMAMEEWLHRIADLDKDHEKTVIQREKLKAEFCMEVGIDPSSSFGGWEESNHIIFMKIYKKAQVTGMQRKQMIDTMQAQLPKYSKDDILAHEEWFRKMNMIITKYKESDAVYRTTRLDIISEAKRALLEYREQRIDNCVKDAELIEHERHRAIIHRRLMELKSHKAIMDATKHHEELLAQEVLLQEQKEQEEKQALERKQKKELINQFQEQKRLAEEARQLALQQANEEEAQKRREEIELNRPKVEMRAKLLDEKEENKKKREREHEEKEMRRLEVLMKLAQQVPYYDAIQEATSRLDHVTTSAKAHEYQAPLSPGTRGHIPMQGFDNSRIVKDTRFRLAEALRKCGVHQSQAAKEAVARFHPRPHLAIHGLL